MKKYFANFLIAALLVTLAAAQAPKPPAPGAKPAPASKIFPYQYFMDDLPNGLRVIIVPTDFPNLVALYIPVQTGSRNEVEAGKSGYAHLFEHLMFRGSKQYTPEQRDEVLKRAGASSNAYTTDDRTVYHEVFSKEDLEKVLALEADRFQTLQYSPEAYKTETGAVLGEYNKNSSSPTSKLFEVLRETAFKQHPYSHTTMGYLRDIQDMPNQYEYSRQFFQRYYRPEYTTVIIVGDVQHAPALALVKKYFSSWQRGNFKAGVPDEPPQDGPRTAHVDWPAPTLPWVAVAFRAPAYSDTEKPSAALDLMASMAFGSNSELYQRLVLKEQKVEALSGRISDHVDPELFTVFARVKKQEDVAYVRDQILATYQAFGETLVPADKLAATRSRLRYEAAMAMDSSEGIADALAPFIGLRRTPETLNLRYALYDQVTPADIRDVCRQYFTERNRTIVTLATKTAAAPAGGKGGK